MRKLIQLTGAYRWWVVAAWLLLVAAALPLMLHQSDRLTAGGYEVPGSGSQQVQQLVAEKFPALSQEQLLLVIRCDSDVAPESTGRQLERSLAQVGAGGSAVSVPATAAVAAQQAAAAGRRELAIPLHVATGWNGAIDAGRDLTHHFDESSGEQGCRTQVAGRGAQAAALHDVSESGLKQAEMIGMPVLLIMLLVIFGSLAAAALPLVIAGVSLAVTGAAIYLISQHALMSVFAVNMSSMIGLGVAVDYALFVVVRFREELRGGASVAEARAISMRTSGMAVVASGATVVAALSSVFIIDNAALRSMALGAVLVVCVAVLVTVTLLPVLLELLATRIGRVKAGAVERPLESTFWYRWTVRVVERPVIATVLALGVLALLIAPVLSLRMGDDTLRQLPGQNSARQAAETAHRLLGPGADAPVVITLQAREGGAVDADTGRLAVALRADSLVESAEVIGAEGDIRVLAVVLRADYESDAARAFVRSLRSEIVPATGIESTAQVAVGGAGASGVDLIDLVRERLPMVAALVLVLSYLLLALLLRSLVLPLKAIVTNMLSVGAGFGVIVALFQWGWLKDLTGIEPLGHVQSLALPLVLAVVFGLSMDYEVFLLSRIRERWEATGDDRRAVAEGVGSTAGVISSAAVIMIAVFAAFGVTGIPVVQQLGIACAVAVAVDATITRLILVPATMTMLGRWNWYFPAPLRKIRVLQEASE
ncbi:MMPL family transporter [Nocardia sp. NPDC056541]|uniref:MMPL family transporter n=1 Tax=Nocardia sp. NPDC056541 TaxID=3345860 RepID=UPI00366D4E8C